MSARATAVVVVPTSRITVSPLRTSPAAARPMRGLLARLGSPHLLERALARPCSRGHGAAANAHHATVLGERVQVAAHRHLGDAEHLSELGDPEELALVQRREHALSPELAGHRLALAVERRRTAAATGPFVFRVLCLQLCSPSGRACFAYESVSRAPEQLARLPKAFETSDRRYMALCAT